MLSGQYPIERRWALVWAIALISAGVWVGWVGAGHVHGGDTCDFAREEYRLVEGLVAKYPVTYNPITRAPIGDKETRDSYDSARLWLALGVGKACDEDSPVPPN